MRKIFEVLIDEDNINAGVNAISLVDDPAIELDFITLKKESTKIQMAEVSEERQILMGAVLVPNKPIVRLDPEGNEFYIIFSKETIRRAMELFFIRGNQSQVTEDHRLKLNGNTVVESWIVEDTNIDKSKLYNLTAPVGSWMVSMKIDDRATYDKAKTGELNGFSIEGFFVPELREQLETAMGGVDKNQIIVDGIHDILREAFGGVTNG